MEIDDRNKKRKVRSWVWEHYNEISSNFAECTNCFAQIPCQNGTNSMKNHLEKKHNIQKIELVQEKKPKTIFHDTDAANKMLYVLDNYFDCFFSHLLQLIFKCCIRC
jgi:hypothetical protein